MSGEGQGGDAVTGELRIRTEGGVAHFPGLARERVVCLDQVPAADAREIARLADEAGFFDCAEPERDVPCPDARCHTLRLALGARSRELLVPEPVRDPALGRLIAAARRLAADTGGRSG